jgi:putative membrane protein
MAYLHKYFENSSKNLKITSLFFVVFYTVGIIGMSIPQSYPLFLKLIPFALILSFVALVFFQTSKMEWKVFWAFLGIYLISFIVEAIGVNTGQVFGYYTYGSGLGPKVFKTPIIIGFNWLFLIYTTSSVVERWHIHPISKIIIASIGMLLYDLVLEQLAPKLEMWHWKNEIIPLQNYLAWFGLALLFQSILKILNIKIKNSLALLLLGCQFLFFLLLFILFKIV